MNLAHSEILQRAISKAIANGWQAAYDDYGNLLLGDPSSPRMTYTPGPMASPEDKNILFDKSFAKALWGEDLWERYQICFEPAYTRGASELSSSKVNLTEWQYHLQQMVIADDPIAYLGEHL